MNYDETISFLYGLRKHGVKLGLERIKHILQALGNPEQQFSSIHIAGTNGKGSTAAACEAILRSHGYKTGLFTSPHLVSFTERIKLNREEIAESDVIRIAALMREKTERVRAEHGQPTFFEFVTAMAFFYFAEMNIRWAVVETGMGGRLDATNSIIPAVSVITPISFDHKEFLGDSLKDIAFEKAGIIKQGVPVVSACQKKEAAELLVKTSEARGTGIYFYGKDFHADNINTDIEGSAFDYKNGGLLINNLRMPLAGDYQPENASLAIKAVSLALNSSGSFSSGKVRPAISSIKWPGRLEKIADDPLIIIDAAHNPEAAEALAGFLKNRYKNRKLIFIIGIMADKDIRGVLKPLLHIADKVVFTAPSNERAASAQNLLDAAVSEIGCSKCIVSASVSEAIDLARTISAELSVAQEPAPVIVGTGSFYTIGEIKAALGAKRTLHDLTEKL